MLEDKKRRYLRHCYSDRGVKGTIENWTYISLFNWQKPQKPSNQHSGNPQKTSNQHSGKPQKPSN